MVFVCVKSLQVPYIDEAERLVISRVGPPECRMFRCIVRYGYKDLQQEKYDFENRLISEMIQFVETEEGGDGMNIHVSCLKEESMEILGAKESGVAYILGHSYAKAKKSSSVFKKLAIDVLYSFLNSNCREADVILNVPHSGLLEVGMIYYV